MYSAASIDPDHNNTLMTTHRGRVACEGFLSEVPTEEVRGGQLHLPPLGVRLPHLQGVVETEDEPRTLTIRLDRY